LTNIYFYFPLFPIKERSFYVDAILSLSNTWTASYQDFSFNFTGLKLKNNNCQAGDILTWKPSSEMGTFKCVSIYKIQSVICIGILPKPKITKATTSTTTTSAAITSTTASSTITTSATTTSTTASSTITTSATTTSTTATTTSITTASITTTLTTTTSTTTTSTTTTSTTGSHNLSYNIFFFNFTCKGVF
jgi:hypothetical protein